MTTAAAEQTDRFPTVSDRWWEAMDDATPADVTARDRIQAIFDASAFEIHALGEACFIAAAADGSGHGLLIEFEFNDEYTPPAEQWAALESAVAEAGEGLAVFDRVNEGSGFVFGERAAVRAFLPLDAVTPERGEKIAAAIVANLYGEG